MLTRSGHPFRVLLHHAFRKLTNSFLTMPRPIPRPDINLPRNDLLLASDHDVIKLAQLGIPDLFVQ